MTWLTCPKVWRKWEIFALIELESYNHQQSSLLASREHSQNFSTIKQLLFTTFSKGPPFFNLCKKCSFSIGFNVIALFMWISHWDRHWRALSGSLSVTLADESWKSPLIEDKKYNWYIRWRHIEKIVLLKCSYISGNFDLIQGIRLSLELARKIGLITMMKYQNFEKKFEK